MEPDVRRGEKDRRLGAGPTAGEDQGKGFQSIIDKLTKWIPGDTLALYVPGVTFLAADDHPTSVSFLVVMLVATPAFVVLAAFATGRKMEARVWVSALLAGVAFAIWSTSVPLSGWQRWEVVAQNQAYFSIGATVLGLLFGYFAEGVLMRLPAEH